LREEVLPFTGDKEERARAVRDTKRAAERYEEEFEESFSENDAGEVQVGRALFRKRMMEIDETGTMDNETADAMFDKQFVEQGGQGTPTKVWIEKDRERHHKKRHGHRAAMRVRTPGRSSGSNAGRGERSATPERRGRAQPLPVTPASRPPSRSASAPGLREREAGAFANSHGEGRHIETRSGSNGPVRGMAPIKREAEVRSRSRGRSGAGIKAAPCRTRGRNRAAASDKGWRRRPAPPVEIELDPENAGLSWQMQRKEYKELMDSHHKELWPMITAVKRAFRKTGDEPPIDLPQNPTELMSTLNTADLSISTMSNTLSKVKQTTFASEHEAIFKKICSEFPDALKLAKQTLSSLTFYLSERTVEKKAQSNHVTYMNRKVTLNRTYVEFNWGCSGNMFSRSIF